MSKKIRLPNVTLIAVSSVALDETLESLKISARDIEFGAVKMLASDRPELMPAGFEFGLIPPLDLLGYNSFIMNQLYKHFETSHCLVVQADGFVINPGLWREEFLHYDYIGAPWPNGFLNSSGDLALRLDRNRVGNGGFSLRSRRLMSLTAQIDFTALQFPTRSEDLIICHFLYPEMCAKGMVFAPLDLAAVFSMEHPARILGQRLESVFGFHGKHLMSEAQKQLSM